MRSQNVRADRDALRTATFEELGERGWQTRGDAPLLCVSEALDRLCDLYGVPAKTPGGSGRLQHGPLAHAPWPRVMAALTCTARQAAPERFTSNGWRACAGSSYER